MLSQCSHNEGTDGPQLFTTLATTRSIETLYVEAFEAEVLKVASQVSDEMI